MFSISDIIDHDLKQMEKKIFLVAVKTDETDPSVEEKDAKYV